MFRWPLLRRVSHILSWDRAGLGVFGGIERYWGHVWGLRGSDWGVIRRNKEMTGNKGDRERLERYKGY